MAVKSLTPSRGFPHFNTLVYPKVVPLNTQLTTAGGVVTLTAAQLLGGLLTIDTDDAQSLTLPTATLLSAEIPGIDVGTAFDFDVINYGDTTLTMVIGAGITNKSISSSTSVMTIVAQASKRFKLVCTAVKAKGAAADTWDLYGFGSIAAANA